ncbi:HesA/MoeB/ThiF family protein [Cohnella suwonensis]|uniref:HesA/MoeB/ThiF family protein n=1 Tax=Cohnella suwonensis TaxID=696072 RepID=A0ABW0M123_9BACL
MGNAAKPIFKKILFVRRIEDGNRLRIGELIPKRAVEIEDEDGSIAKLIRLMDGTRDTDQIWDEMKRDHSELTMDDLIQMVSELDELGFLEDARAEGLTRLSLEERDRYKANLNYFSLYSTMTKSSIHLQEQLKQAHITIIGVGTLGSGILFNLACLGVESVRIVDFDRVERSNLNRQILYDEQDIGRRKIDAAADNIRRFHSAMKIEAVDLEMTSAETAKHVIAGSSLVVLAADQPFVQLERWVNQACLELRVPWIGGGVNLVEGQFYSVIPGQTGCIECNHLIQNEADASRASFLTEYLASGFRMPSTAIAAHYMLLIGAVASEIARMLTGFAPLQSAGKVIAMDFHTYTSEVRMDFTATHPRCPLCNPMKSRSFDG